MFEKFQRRPELPITGTVKRQRRSDCNTMTGIDWKIGAASGAGTMILPRHQRFYSNAAPALRRKVRVWSPAPSMSESHSRDHKGAK